MPKRFLFAACLAACTPMTTNDPYPPSQPMQQPMQPMQPMAAAPGAPNAQPQQQGERRLRFNGTPLDARGLQVIVQLETHANTRLPDGDYWYDPASGASGPWGGGVFVVLPPNLPLGGPLRPDSSGGGNGNVTGVFANGRELHPTDVAALSRFIQVIPGRYTVDAQGNVGQEGGGFLFNANQLAQQKSGSSHKSGNTWTGGGAATSTWGSNGGEITNNCSYDPSDGAGVMCSKIKNY